MNLKTALILCCVVALGGCASSTQYISPKPSNTQKLVFLQPTRTILGSQETKGGVLTEIYFEPTAGNKLFNGTAVFWICVKNKDTAPFTFGPSSVSVVDASGKPVQMMSLSDLSSRLQANKSRQEWGYILVNSMMSALAAAPYMTNQQVGTYNGYSNNGQYVQGTYVGTSTNKTVQYMAQQEGSAQNASISQQMDAALAQALSRIQQLTLSESTVASGMLVKGIVAVPLSSALPNRYKFIV
ncbi:MAG: hypothetical protein ACKODK_09995, partial [Opitutaceae bacterium]